MHFMQASMNAELQSKRIPSVELNKQRLRGGVSRLCGGPSAVSYLKLAQGLWSPTGKQSARGAHQEGTFDSMPVFKVPSSIIPTDEILTV
jgi:hypothetical protein